MPRFCAGVVGAVCVRWRLSMRRWRAGRKDNDVKAVPAGGRLPAADKGNPMATAQGLRDVFYRMGFNDREIVALSGAHALGR